LSGGVFAALLAFALFPFVWSLPESLVTAELGSAYPEASGTVAWVEEAFPNKPYLAWLQGCLTWTSGATDNAIYPVLFWEYMRQLFLETEDQENSDLHPTWWRFLFLSGTSCALAYINYRGLDVVGDMSITICVLSMIPFIVFIAIGFFQIQPSRWLPSGSSSSLKSIKWAPFLNNLFWNLNSFDSASCFAAEVQNPGRSFPRAMFISVILVSFAYELPLLVATGCTNANREDWVDGYLTTIVMEVAGRWCGAWVVFAAGLSNLAMFQSEMSSDAYQLMGMAERGFLPKILAQKSKYGTPLYAILLGLFVIVVLNLSQNLMQLIEMLNFNYALSLLLEYSAFLRLRWSKPDLERPYRIPFSNWGCIFLLLPAILCTILIISLASWSTYVFCLGTIVICMVWWQFKVKRENYTTVNSKEGDESESTSNVI